MKFSCTLWCLAWHVDAINPSYYVFDFHASLCLQIGEGRAVLLENLRRSIIFLGKWPRWRTILFCTFIFTFNSLHVSSTSCSSSGETNFVNTMSGNCHSLLVAVSYAGRKFTSDLHTTRPPAVDRVSYQRLYWHSLSLLMMSTMCSKHVES
jgi:hypothetical protein